MATLTNLNSDWLADQWNERSVLGHAQFDKGSKGDDPEIDTAQTPKRFDGRATSHGSNPGRGGGVLDQLLDGDVPSRLQKHTRSLYQCSKMCTRRYTNFPKMHTRPYTNYENCEN